MARDHDEFLEETRSSRDNSSEAPSGARPSVEPPYRDRRDALVARRRALSREREDASRAADRRDRLTRHLEVIDDELRASSGPLLHSIAIARPCRARWDDMVGDDVVRHCARCDRDVHDLSLMSRDQVHALFAIADGTPCVRLRRRADGRIVTADCPVTPLDTTSRALAFAAAGAVFGMTASGAFAILTATTHRAARSSRDESSTAAATSAALGPSIEPDLLAAIDVDALRAEPSPDITMGAVSTEPVAPLDLDRQIRWTAPQSWDVDRVVLDHALDPAASQRTSVRVLPHQRGRSVMGVQLYGVRRDELLGRLGLRNGDVLLDVNGYEVATPEGALEAYARLRNAPTFFVRLERSGRERLHVYRITP